MKGKSLARLFSIIFVSFVFISYTDAYRKQFTRKQIQGGDVPPLGDFSYTVAIQEDGITICSGGILDERHVITAAHCLINTENEFMGSPLEIVAGTNDLKDGDTDTTVRIKVERAYVSSEYKFSEECRDRIGDIAVLRLSKPLNLAKNAKLGKLELPKATAACKNYYVGVEAVVSGFGCNSAKIKYDPELKRKVAYDWVCLNELRHATSQVLSNRLCNEKSKRPVHRSQLCAQIKQRSPEKPEGTCKADSGAPLVYEGILIGVVESGPMNCMEDKNPAFYTRVTSYLDFIEKSVKGSLDNTARVIDLPISRKQAKTTFQKFKTFFMQCKNP